MSDDARRPILIAPVSGGAFPHQMEMIASLSDVGFNPYLAFASSGGNVATYLTFAGNFNRSNIKRVSKDICSEFFVKSWLPPPMKWLPSVTAGFFMGSVYQSNPNVSKIFETYFTPGSVQIMEIWTGTTNQKTSAAGFFCNRSRDTSIIQGHHYHSSMVNGEPLHYMAGDLITISKASAASATIPTLVESQDIKCNDYVDGGVKYASPFTAMEDEVRAIWKKRGYLHMVYINGYDIQEKMALNKQASELRNLHGVGSNIPKPDNASKEMQNIIETGLSATHHMVMGMLLSDRKIAYTMIREIAGEINEEHIVYHADIPNKYIMEVWKILKNSNIPAYLFELYSTCKEYINYTDFDGDDIITYMEKTKGNFSGRVWWVTCPNLFESIGKNRLVTDSNRKYRQVGDSKAETECGCD